MRFLVYPSVTGPRIGVVDREDFVDLGLALADRLVAAELFEPSLARRLADATFPQDVAVLLARGQEALSRAEEVLAAVRSLSDGDRSALRDSGIVRPLEGAELLPPLGQEARVFSVGRNYEEHRAEGGAGSAADPAPAIFTKTHASLVGHGQTISIPASSEQLDWEVELTAVIAKPGRSIRKDTALAHVGGYTITNDGSVRDYQFLTRWGTPGKNFDRSGSMGPWIQTADGIPDPQDVEVKTTLNDTVMQSANTRDMTFSVAELISFISEWVTLQPGDCITTGSPAGVGLSQHPPRWLKAGDRLRFSVEGIGELENVVGN